MELCVFGSEGFVDGPVSGDGRRLNFYLVITERLGVILFRRNLLQ
jgi:hypothetical protein